MAQRTHVPRSPCLFVPLYIEDIVLLGRLEDAGGSGRFCSFTSFKKNVTLKLDFSFPHLLWFRIQNVSKMVSCTTSLIVPSCGGLGMFDYYPSLVDISNSWDQIT